jgi:hypothetical protein
MFGLLLQKLLTQTDQFRPFPEQHKQEPLGPSALEVCSRGAFGVPQAVGEATGIEHWWLKSGAKEAGMNFNQSTLNPLDTTMVDQSGDSLGEGVSCVPMEAMFPEHADVDPACVEDMMTPGKLDLGNYGVDGVCKDAVETILDYCDPTYGPKRPDGTF